MNYDTMTKTIDISDLLRLKKSIDEYVDAACVAEECYFSDDPETEYVQQRVVNYGMKLKSRIRNAAIDFGINRDFLAEYDALKDLSIDPMTPDVDPFLGSRLEKEAEPSNSTDNSPLGTDPSKKVPPLFTSPNAKEIAA